ncbi:putative DNA-binding domain-containing protein [Neiella marina]|uniref:DNA-binding domain-containing protein n=1 Tax=Neiella holothuriorum TaxID=2870530 RepID=A0ABS7ECY1_9GAMM|nr:putative DNA-binding domain-containing protein [Neiella holothuriorum]MBW8190194.1 putative DNA-binding domain-containing protein [Neiella holothuriorum]
MSQSDDYRWHQRQFASYIRNPEQNTPPQDIEPRRLAVYRRLVFNNVKSFVEEAFPVLWSVWGEHHLDEEVADFLALHTAESPYFIDIAEEFLQYLISERQAKADDPPFLIELAHYEWVEFEVAFHRPSRLVKPLLADNIGLSTPIELAETARALQYQFSVHQIRTDFQPNEPAEQPVYLVVYRNDEDDVKFMEVNAVTARLLQQLAEQPGQTVQTLIELMQQLMPEVAPEQISQGLIQVLASLCVRGIVKQSLKPA